MRTSDVYLASACLALGYKLETVDRKDPRHMVFEFSAELKSGVLGALQSELLEKVETEWANKTLVVNGWDFAEAIKRMKSIIHSS